MNKTTIGQRILTSSFFKRIKNKAGEYLSSPEKLINLVNKAITKVNKTPKGALREVIDNLRILFRMVCAYAQREYTDVPWLSMSLIVATILYFLIPTDCIPDFIFALGFIDDASVIVWTVAAIRKDIDKFLNWEINRQMKPLQSLDSAPEKGKTTGHKLRLINNIKKEISHNAIVAKLILQLKLTCYRINRFIYCILDNAVIKNFHFRIFARWNLYHQYF